MAKAAKTTTAEDNNGLTHTATLIRGKNYIHKNIHFKAGVGRRVTAELAEELSELKTYSRDTRSDDQIEHDRFKIVEGDGADTDMDEDEEVQTARARRPSKIARRVHR